MSPPRILAPLAGSAVFNTLAFAALIAWARRLDAHRHPHAAA